MKFIKYLFISIIIFMLFPIIVKTASLTCNYSGIVSNLTSFYNSLEYRSIFILQTNKFLCSNLTCTSSSTYSNIGLLNLSEYEEIGETSSFLSSLNSYWTMTETGNSAYQIKSTGSELLVKTGTSGIKPVVYINNDIEVEGTGNKTNPYTFILPELLALGTTYEFSYTGSVQSFTVPENGIYRLEVWGAQGGGNSDNGGKGGYSIGDVALSKNQTLYIYVGQKGPSGGTDAITFGGGGLVGISYTIAGQGGGASDIRIGTNNLYARVIVAGGGGGAHTLYGGGYGGGSTGGQGLINSSSLPGGLGGTQTLGGDGRAAADGTFGQGGGQAGYTDGSGGGGWYGGGMGYTGSSQTGGGGSSWIYTASTFSVWQTAYPSLAASYWLLNSSYYLANASTIAGNASMPSPSGSTETGHSGNGYATIELIDYN